MGATEQLAQFIADTRYDTLPREVIAAAKSGIPDGVANLLAGSTQPLAGILSAYIQPLGGTRRVVSSDGTRRRTHLVLH